MCRRARACVCVCHACKHVQMDPHTSMSTSTCLSTDLSTHPSVCDLSILQSTSTDFNIDLSIDPSIRLSILRSIHLSTYLYAMPGRQRGRAKRRTRGSRAGKGGGQVPLTESKTSFTRIVPSSSALLPHAFLREAQKRHSTRESKRAVHADPCRPNPHRPPQAFAPQRVPQPLPRHARRARVW